MRTIELELHAALEEMRERAAEVGRLRAELAASQARTDSVMETLFKVCEFVEIDYEAARSAPGKPSDVIVGAITKKVAASQEEMRERCAVAAWMAGMAYHNRVLGMPTDAREVGSSAASDIRALEVKP